MYFAARQSFKNREALADSDEAACYHCLSSFTPAEVTHWTDDGATALCPRCGIDSVLPGHTDAEALHSAHEWGFEPISADEPRGSR